MTTPRTLDRAARHCSYPLVFCKQPATRAFRALESKFWAEWDGAARLLDW
jgi:hypothetical protein